ncbi:MAG: hypothetical protein AAGF77_13965 [Bacteroidota bacterium]
MKTRLGRISKILAMLLGTLITCVAAHMPLSLLFGNRLALVITTYTFFIIWPLLMCVVYWIKKPWVSWAVLMGAALVLYITFYLAK